MINLAKWYANFCDMSFLNSLGFVVCMRSGGCHFTAWVCLSSSCPTALRPVADCSMSELRMLSPLGMQLLGVS